MAYKFWATKRGQKMRKRGFTKKARKGILSRMDSYGRYKGPRARLLAKKKGIKGRGSNARKAYFARYTR